MTNWSEKHIRQLQAGGRIKGARIPEKRKGHSSSKRQYIPPAKGKALTWLEWNLAYWSNERALTMEREYKFCPDRGWRFDFCWPSVMVALEFEGGIYLQNSGHNTAKHFSKDSDKYNRAAVLGWRVVRVTAKNYQTALSTLNEMIK